MKTTILLFTMIIFNLSTSFAQTDNYKAEVLQMLDIYFDATEKKDFAKTLDFIHPKFFTLTGVSKEKIVKAFEEKDKDTTVSILLERPIIESISDCVIEKNKKYCLINYSFSMTLILKEDSTDSSSEEANDITLDLTSDMLREKHGEQNVTCDKENRTIVVQVKNEMYAINDPTYNGWKILEKKEEMKPLLKKILPKKVLQKL